MKDRDPYTTPEVVQMSTLEKGRPRTTEPPAKPGVYRIIDKDTGKVVKIGETNDLKRRKREHFRKD